MVCKLPPDFLHRMIRTTFSLRIILIHAPELEHFNHVAYLFESMHVFESMFAAFVRGVRNI